MSRLEFLKQLERQQHQLLQISQERMIRDSHYSYFNSGSDIMSSNANNTQVSFSPFDLDLNVSNSKVKIIVGDKFRKVGSGNNIQEINICPYKYFKKAKEHEDLYDECEVPTLYDNRNEYIAENENLDNSKANLSGECSNITKNEIKHEDCCGNLDNNKHECYSCLKQKLSFLNDNNSSKVSYYSKPTFPQINFQGTILPFNNSFGINPYMYNAFNNNIQYSSYNFMNNQPANQYQKFSPYSQQQNSFSNMNQTSQLNLSNSFEKTAFSSQQQNSKIEKTLISSLIEAKNKISILENEEKHKQSQNLNNNHNQSSQDKEFNELIEEKMPQIEKLETLVTNINSDVCNADKIIKAYRSKLKCRNWNAYLQNSKITEIKNKFKFYHKCNFPGCNRTFSSSGWLKTHLDEHILEIQNDDFNKDFNLCLNKIKYVLYVEV